MDGKTGDGVGPAGRPAVDPATAVQPVDVARRFRIALPGRGVQRALEDRHGADHDRRRAGPPVVGEAWLGAAVDPEEEVAVVAVIAARRPMVEPDRESPACLRIEERSEIADPGWSTAGTSIHAVSVKSSVPRTIPGTSRRPPAATSQGPLSSVAPGNPVIGSSARVVDDVTGDDRAHRLDGGAIGRHAERRDRGGGTDPQALVPGRGRQTQEA